MNTYVLYRKRDRRSFGPFECRINDVFVQKDYITEPAALIPGDEVALVDTSGAVLIRTAFVAESKESEGQLRINISLEHPLIKFMDGSP